MDAGRSLKVKAGIAQSSAAPFAPAGHNIVVPFNDHMLCLAQQSVCGGFEDIAFRTLDIDLEQPDVLRTRFAPRFSSVMAGTVTLRRQQPRFTVKAVRNPVGTVVPIVPLGGKR